MNPVLTKGQVVICHEPISFFQKGKQYACHGSSSMFLDRPEYLGFSYNRIGAASRWSVQPKHIAEYISKGFISIIDAIDKTQIKKAVVPVPIVVGAYVMVQRHYNSKRIVMEPVRINSLHGDLWHGTWGLDGTPLAANEKTKVEPFNPKWVEKKLEQLHVERDTILSQISNLSALPKQ